MITYTSSKKGIIVDVIIFMISVIILYSGISFQNTADGDIRADALGHLIDHGTMQETKYSMVGPIFSAPLYIIGKWASGSGMWIIKRFYNFTLFAAGLICMYVLLSPYIPKAVLRRFILLLIFGSMFPQNIGTYLGETFTAVFVGIGIIGIFYYRSPLGWILTAIGVANTPAMIVGFGLIAAYQAFREKKMRFLLTPLIALFIIIVNNLFVFGSPFASGYDGDHGMKTILPYSGLPGFSYPFFFGLLSLLFSFGKGLLFFAPGLLLLFVLFSDKTSTNDTPSVHLMIYWLLFLIGCVLIYSKWWSWYGGWFWGPRFLLFASIPSSLALAIMIPRENNTIGVDLLLTITLIMSYFVGISASAFGNADLFDIAVSNNFAQEYLVWYIPEFSVLWRPFVNPMKLLPKQIILIVYTTVIFIYVGFPLYSRLIHKTYVGFNSLMRTLLAINKWRL